MTAQMKKTNQDRVSVRINSKLEKKLMGYVAAAGAAGVGILASAQPAECKIIYTPTNTTIGNTTLLDLNNDGIVDFSVGFSHISHLVGLLAIPKVSGNAIRAGNQFGAAPAFVGVPIGPAGVFISNTWYGLGVELANGYGYGPYTSFGGPWANTTNRYLGLKFLINGQTHYGWARISVGNFMSGQPVVLTGYAYETVPNTKIIAGHTFGPAIANMDGPEILAVPSQPATLGVLARGAGTLSIWRKGEEEAEPLSE